MRKFTIFSCIILFVIASCNNEDEISDSASLNNQDDSTSEIILQERDPNLPKVWSKKIAPRPSTRTSFTDATDFLGNSYAIENGTSIIGDFSNARFPIVNMEKLLERYPSYIIAKELRTTSTEAMSYASFERLETTSSFTKTVKSGFSLNIGPFKLGRKKTVTDIFKHNTSNSEQAVHGELSVEVINGMISLQTAPSALRRISADYLDELFVDALYNSSMVELIQSYGEFVLTSYYTGGRASALYYGLDTQSTDFNSKERDMDKSINATYSWNKDSVSGDFSVGTKRYKGKTMHLAEDEILVIEGIHCLNDKLTSQIPKENKFKIYISALTVLNMDYFNRISTTDNRLVRSNHSGDRLFFRKMVVAGMEQYDICRIKPVEAVDLRRQKLYILAAETAMIKRSDPAFALTGTDKIKLIPGCKQFLPKRIQIASEKIRSFRNGIT